MKMSAIQVILERHQRIFHKHFLIDRTENISLTPSAHFYNGCTDIKIHCIFQFTFILQPLKEQVLVNTMYF